MIQTNDKFFFQKYKQEYILHSIKWCNKKTMDEFKYIQKCRVEQA